MNFIKSFSSYLFFILFINCLFVSKIVFCESANSENELVSVNGYLPALDNDNNVDLDSNRYLDLTK